MIGLLAAFAASAVLADDVPAPKKLDPKLENLVREAVMSCKEMTLSQEDSPLSLPSDFTSTMVKISSPRSVCETTVIGVKSRSGGVYVGVPWMIKEAEGKTLEEKLKNFTWTNMHTNFEPQIDRRNPTADGLFKVTLLETTERGKLPMEGEVDPLGNVFFLGHFRRPNDDVRAVRLKALEPFIAQAPTEGSSKPSVTVIEFSDFQCPSCQHAAGFLDPILSKYSEKVRYVRYDLPLMSVHPWAFSAAVAGRAIYRQNPTAFWAFKKQVYENQPTLSAFMIDDFARNFAKDHDLDMKKYDADVASAEIGAELLKAEGAAFSNDIRSTPTYLVNGRIVDAGEGGKALEEYVAGLLK